MKFLGYIFLFLSVQFCFGQKSNIDTTWFDSQWKEVSKKYASFYRTIKKTENVYLVTDSYLNGKPQMVAEYSSIKRKKIQDGFAIYYNDQGNVKEYGNYKKNKRIGRWVEYIEDGKDSTVCTILDNGKKEYSRLVMKDKDGIYTLVEEMPEYPGGVSEMFIFIRQNLKYPQEAKEKGWGGKSYVQFIVDETGKLTNAKILKSSGYEILDHACLDLIKIMPIWKAGVHDGNKVSVKVTVPLNFTMKK